MITINLLRITPDSEYLEFSVECPIGYKFNVLNIKRYSNTIIYDTIDASNLYKLNPDSLKQLMRIKITALGGTGMFQVEFGVTLVDSESGLPNLDNVIAICSDVNNVYSYLLNDILNLDANCISQSEYQNLTRNYLFLYAHIEAMRQERFDDAGMFYDILKKNFSNCVNTSNSNPRITNNCNCK